jgi:hypothetical protein
MKRKYKVLVQNFFVTESPGHSFSYYPNYMYFKKKIEYAKVFGGDKGLKFLALFRYKGAKIVILLGPMGVAKILRTAKQGCISIFG